MRKSKVFNKAVFKGRYPLIRAITEAEKQRRRRYQYDLFPVDVKGVDVDVKKCLGRGSDPACWCSYDECSISTVEEATKCLRRRR